MPVTDDQCYKEIIRRIVEAAHPLKVILFDSSARGQATPGSDVDLLVVMPDGTHRLSTSQAIYRNLIGLEFAVDVIVAVETDLSDYKDTPGLIYREALREGRVIFAA